MTTITEGTGTDGAVFCAFTARVDVFFIGVFADFDDVCVVLSCFLATKMTALYPRVLKFFTVSKINTLLVKWHHAVATLYLFFTLPFYFFPTLLWSIRPTPLLPPSGHAISGF